MLSKFLSRRYGRHRYYVLCSIYAGPRIRGSDPARMRITALPKTVQEEQE